MHWQGRNASGASRPQLLNFNVIVPEGRRQHNEHHQDKDLDIFRICPHPTHSLFYRAARSPRIAVAPTRCGLITLVHELHSHLHQVLVLHAQVHRLILVRTLFLHRFADQHPLLALEAGLDLLFSFEQKRVVLFFDDDEVGSQAPATCISRSE